MAKITPDELKEIREGVRKLKLAAVDGERTKAEIAPATTKQPERPSFGQIPHHWNPIIIHANAYRAMPLLTAIACQMERYHKSRIFITSESWALAGSPGTEGKRHAMLAALIRIPSIIHLEPRERPGLKYAVRKGIWFDRVPPRLVKDADG
jgi:hypothetical protein